MTYLSIYSLLPPCYENLSEEIKNTFEASVSGNKLIQWLQSYNESVYELAILKGAWFGFIHRNEENDKAFEANWALQKKQLMHEISENEDYKMIIKYLTHQMLQKEIDEFKYLPLSQQEVLSQAVFSHELLTTLDSLDQTIEEEKLKWAEQGLWQNLNVFQFKANFNDRIIQLQSQRQEALIRWQTQFQMHPYMNFIRQTLVDNKELLEKENKARQLSSLQEHAKSLNTFFPLLNYRQTPGDKKLIDKLNDQYLSLTVEQTLEIDKIEEDHLTDLLFHCMQQLCEVEIDFTNLDSFNKLKANQLAVIILNAFNDNAELDLDNWFELYEKDLLKHLTQELQLINGLNWEMKEKGVKEELFNSLSYLWDNQAVNKVNEFMGKMADAHGFIQATSFSTQNESSFLAILDMYNYARHYEQISETRSIFFSLLSPLTSLYNEYKDIAFYEKNLYWKSFRIIMPLVVVNAFVMAVAVLLAPLALPELALTAAFLPSLLAGLSLANRYVTFKNEIYKSLREYYYGGAFEIPEFQINARMLRAFGNHDNANKVRIFYIAALQRCDAIEIQFSEKHKLGILSQQDMVSRKENMTQLHHLSLEWYDIHSNIDLGYQQASSIFLKHLQQVMNQEYKILQKTVKEESNALDQLVKEVSADLKCTIDKKAKASLNQKDSDVEYGQITIHSRYGLFKPVRCLNAKENVEALIDFQEQICPNSSG